MIHTVSDDKIPLLLRYKAAASERYERQKDPPRNTCVYVLARDRRGEYNIPFPVIFTKSDVLNAQMRVPLADEVSIVAWRLP